MGVEGFPPSPAPTACCQACGAWASMWTQALSSGVAACCPAQSHSWDVGRRAALALGKYRRYGRCSIQAISPWQYLFKSDDSQEGCRAVDGWACAVGITLNRSSLQCRDSVRCGGERTVPGRRKLRAAVPSRSFTVGPHHAEPRREISLYIRFLFPLPSLEIGEACSSAVCAFGTRV